MSSLSSLDPSFWIKIEGERCRETWQLSINYMKLGSATGAPGFGGRSLFKHNGMTRHLFKSRSFSLFPTLMEVDRRVFGIPPS